MKAQHVYSLILIFNISITLWFPHSAVSQEIGQLTFERESWLHSDFRAVAGDRLFWVNQRRLWCTDGTPDSTTLVLDWTSTFGDIWEMVGGNDGKLYFTAREELDDPFGLELWVSDGTPEGTHRVEDLNPGPGWGVGNLASQNDKQIVNFNGIVIWNGNNGQSEGLFYIDTNPPLPKLSVIGTPQIFLLVVAFYFGFWYRDRRLRRRTPLAGH